MNKGKLRKDVLSHLKMIARLYSFGVPLIECVEVFCVDSPDWKDEIIQKLRLGKTFSQSLMELNLPLRDYELTIISKSEDSGNLSQGINRIYEMNKSLEKSKSKFLMALFYPAIILIVSSALILTILTMIVPKIKPLFSGGKINIPITTKILFFLSDNLMILIMSFLSMFIALFLMTLFFIKRYGVNAFKNYVSNAIVKVPIIGNLMRHYSASISFRIASEVFSSSGLLVESIRDSARGAMIPREKLKLLNIAKEVESGVSLSKSIGKEVSKENKMWVPLVVCGEQTGSISETFSSISEIHQDHFNEGIALVNKLVEPLSMIVVGLGVGFIAVSIITPMYSLISYTGY